MFTLEQVQEVHSEVKSGADFPKYVIFLQRLGVESYEYIVSDGVTNYSGANEFKITSDPKYPLVEINQNVNKDQFKEDLKNHQSGKTDFMTFINDCAKSGIVKWKLDVVNKLCIYFDSLDNVVLEEHVPA